MLKKIWGGVKKFAEVGEAGPGPHGVKSGLKRVPTHLAFFGAPSMAVALAIPPGPWKWLPAGVMLVQGIRGEWDDYHNGQDTLGKALIDVASQSTLAVVGALI